MGYKVRRAAQSAFTGCMLLLFLNFLITRSTALPRASMLIFAILVLVSTPGVRWLKHLLLEWDNEGSPSSISAPAEAAEGPILVVGGAGYIGAVLVRKLLDREAPRSV